MRPKNMENPRTKRFLEEFKSTSCRLERPTAVIIPEQGMHLHHCNRNTCKHRQTHVTCYSPNNVQNMPPRIGSGREAKRAVNFPTDPNTNMMAAPYCTTRLLPTCMHTHQY